MVLGEAVVMRDMMVVGGKKGNDETEDEPEIDEDVQLVNKGDVHCVWCNKDLKMNLK